MSSSNCCFLICIQISQEAGQVVLYFHLLKNFPQFVVIHMVKSFSVVSKAEVDVFLELFCFFHDPTDAGNLISGSSAFTKLSLSIWKFSVHVLLKPSLKDFKHDRASRWNECNCVVGWTCFGIALLWDWNETDLFESGGYCWVFQIFWHLDCSTLTALSLRVLNCSARIPSPSLALFVQCFLRPSWLHTPGYLTLGEWSHNCDFLGHEDIFCTVLLCILPTSNIFCFC